MNNIDIFIKEMSLIFTNTLTSDDFCCIGFNLDEQIINYDNTISLYNLINNFNASYLNFKKEYDNLNINLAGHIEFERYYKKDNYRCLSLYLRKPTMTDYEKTMLYIRQDEEKLISYITNNNFGKNYYYKIIEINDSKIIELLDLFEKYEYLLNLYNYLKNRLVFGDSINVLLTKIEGNIFKNITNFKLFLGQLYFNYSNNIDIDIKLEKELKIKSNKAEAEFKSNNYPISDEEVNKVLTKTYINKKYLRRDV